MILSRIRRAAATRIIFRGRSDLCIEINWNSFVGIPFQPLGRSHNGVDCYGLAVLVYRAAGIEIPGYDKKYSHPDDITLPALIMSESAALWSRVTPVEPLDLITLRVAGLPWHIGINIDGRHMLHAQSGQNSRIEKLDSSQWSHRILGYWRYRP